MMRADVMQAYISEAVGACVCTPTFAVDKLSVKHKAQQRNEGSLLSRIGK